MIKALRLEYLIHMQFLKYIISGVINTMVGYSVFFMLYKFFKVTPEYANAFGYAIALVVAFLLNRIFVFTEAVIKRSTIPRFIAAFFLAFIINQLVLIIAYRTMDLDAEIAQILAMISYTIIFYFLNKHFVFHERVSHAEPPPPR